jgi:fructose-specific phosphotransferase system IIA component
MNLTQVLQSHCIKVPLQGRDKNSVITELVGILDANKMLLNKDVALQAVLTREQTKSTGIGSGIAIPHGKCNAVRELVIAMGIAPQAIDFNSVDNKPVSIIILLISPIDQTGPHIQALAKISRLLLDEVLRNKLAKAASADEVFELLRNKENE